MENMLTVKQFANQLRLSEPTIRARVRNGLIEGSKIGSTVVIPQSELEFFKNHLTVREYAEKAFLTQESIIYHIKAQNLIAERRGNLYFIPKDAVIGSKWERKRAS